MEILKPIKKLLYWRAGLIKIAFYKNVWVKEESLF